MDALKKKGSHLQLIHPVKNGKVTLPIHGGDIPKGTLNAIMKQAGLKQILQSYKKLYYNLK